jgi:hypothetical protein
MLSERVIFRNLPYITETGIYLTQPILSKIDDIGYDNYQALVSLFTKRPYDLMVFLDDIKIDFETLDNFELFRLLYMQNRDYYNELLKYFFNINIRFIDDYEDNFRIMCEQTIFLEEIFKTNFILNSESYEDFREFFIKTNLIEHERENKFAAKSTKRNYIEVQREEIEDLLKKQIDINKDFYNKIESLVLGSNGSFKEEDVWQFTIYKFTKFLKRLKKKENHDFIMSGYYTGNIDGKKINYESLDWTSLV